jgi:hypothetical protein
MKIPPKGYEIRTSPVYYTERLFDHRLSSDAGFSNVPGSPFETVTRAALNLEEGFLRVRNIHQH